MYGNRTAVTDRNKVAVEAKALDSDGIVETCP